MSGNDDLGIRARPAFRRRPRRARASRVIKGGSVSSCLLPSLGEVPLGGLATIMAMYTWEDNERS